MTSIKQDNFSGGEISPNIQPNTKLTKRQNGLALCRNAVIDRHGTIQNRAGTEYIAEVADSSYAYNTLIEFVLNSSISYQILIEDNQVRVFKGASLNDTITGTPWSGSDVADLQWQQSGNIVTVVSNNYAPYEIERVSDTNWTVSQKAMTPPIDPVLGGTLTPGGAGALTYEYCVTAVDASGNESFPNGGTATTTPGMGPLGEFGEIYDFTIKDSGHSRSAGDRVLIQGSTYLPGLNGHTLSVKATDTNDFTVEGIDLGSLQPVYEEGGARLVTFTSQANPCVVIVSGDHGYSTGQTVYMTGCSMVELNERTFTITVVSTSAFSLDGEDATGHTAGTSGYTHIAETTLTLYDEGFITTTAAAPTTANPHVLTWNAVTNATEYNIYKKNDNDTWGFIGTTTSLTFNDTNLDPDTSIRPPEDSLTFFDDTDWPATVGSYQQRLCYGNTTSDVELFKASRVGAPKDMELRVPAQDDDPVEFSLTGRQVNEIRHIIDVGGLVLLTEGGEWIVGGDANGTLTPASPGLKQGSYRGSSSLRPILIGNKALFAEADGKTIRDLGYEFNSDSYIGLDLTTFASHLFKNNRVIVDWAYQASPNSIIWMIVDDVNWKTNRATATNTAEKNMLIGLTYIPEQEIWAFHRHDSRGGEFESICSTPGTDGDDITVVVKRTINGATKRYVERLNNRVITDHAIDAIFLDSYLSYNGRNNGFGTMTINAITDYAAGTTLTLNSLFLSFVAGDVGNHMRIRSVTYAFNEDTGKVDETVEEVNFRITGFTSGTEVTGICDTDVPTALQATPVTTWGKAVDELSGLTHLEGESVYVIADGVDYGPFTVASGAITLTGEVRAEVAHVGLRYYSDVETLPLDPVGGEALTDKQININKVTLEVSDSRGFKVGPVGPDGPRYDQLSELQDDAYGTDGKRAITISCTWSDNGKIFIRQDKPLAMHITGITFDGQVEGSL